MQIIKKAQRIETVKHCLTFSYNDPFLPGCGFSFDCDAEGNVDTAALQPAAQESLRQCNEGRVTLPFSDGTLRTYAVIRDGVQTYRRSYTEPAIGRCACGEEVELSGFTNTCACGADYNSFGQRLAPRSQWGEETGDSLGDILSIP